MEYPFGHHHHHQRGEEEEREEQQYPPPDYRPDPYSRREEEQYPPPDHRPDPYGRREEQHYPPPDHRPDPYSRREERYPGEGEEYQRPPSFGRQQEQESYYGEDIYQRPQPPSGLGYESGSAYPPVQHVAHEVNQGPYGREEFGPPSSRRTVRVFTKAEENYSLTIRDDKVVLARADQTDEYQHWIKDEKYSTKVKDEEGFPCFALVNKVTGQAVKHSIGAEYPVQLVPYNPDYLDESILWTESRDLGDGFRCIRMVNKITLNFDAFNGDANHGGVRDGTTIVLWEWLKGENQRWKIVPY